MVSTGGYFVAFCCKYSQGFADWPVCLRLTNSVVDKVQQTSPHFQQNYSNKYPKKISITNKTFAKQFILFVTLSDQQQFEKQNKKLAVTGYCRSGSNGLNKSKQTICLERVCRQTILGFNSWPWQKLYVICKFLLYQFVRLSSFRIQ